MKRKFQNFFFFWEECTIQNLVSYFPGLSREPNKGGELSEIQGLKKVGESIPFVNWEIEVETQRRRKRLFKIRVLNSFFFFFFF